MKDLLFPLLVIQLGFYSFWVFILWSKASTVAKKLNFPNFLESVLVNGMLIISLLIIWRIFRMNLDFGIVLGLVSIFAGFSWILGRFLKIKVIQEESRSYFFILIFIFCLRSFVYEPYQIPSTSMFPGLKVGDFVLVNKFAYGLRLPTAQNTFFSSGSPKKGDVAVFVAPHTICNVSATESRPDLSTLPLTEGEMFLNRYNRLQKDRCTRIGIKYVKRVIGEPLDVVELKGYSLFVNGKKVSQFLLSTAGSESLVQETLNNKIYITRRLGEALNQKYKWIIPEGHYLALGDNRDNSLDSRAWGYFSEKRLVGRADFIWMHWPSFSSLPTFIRNKSIH